MCGIFGYVGPQNGVDVVLNGLKRLEYRGYDSAGIAGIQNQKLVSCKEVGKLSALEQCLAKEKFNLHIALGHTRWATHGKPSKVNAHPQFDGKHTLAIVHNGIIENQDHLRKQLIAKGSKFSSETDTEVVAHLIASFYQGDLLQAVKNAIPLLTGAFSIALIHQNHPNQIVAFANHSPLVVGIGAKEAFISSDSHAFSAHTREVIFLSDGEIAMITPEKIEVFDANLEQVQKNSKQLTFSTQDLSKGEYEHYTLKEIFQQPQTIRNALASRFLEEYGTVAFEDVNFEINELLGIQRILILGCGTSLHAGYVAAYMLEEMARLPVSVEIASEFRYKNPIIPHGTFVIAISQSGETADTLASVREVKAKGMKVLLISNTPGSTLSRECDSTIYLNAGPEIGVCSTKAFTSQVVVLSLLTILLARMRHMNKQEGQELLHALHKLPEQVQTILNQAKSIETLAKKYAHYENAYFIGRHYMFPTGLEGALKLKEIAYINAVGYAAGEMKHGPIALLDQQCPVIALCSNQNTMTKMLSNLTEVKARNAPILAIASEGESQVADIADDVIWIPRTLDPMAVILSTVVTQLLAYFIAKERGADIDQPKNLAKSVTVE